MSKVCAQCAHYLGCGDWDLCCKKGVRRLCHEDSPADDCPRFERMEACVNRTSRVGMFRCSVCNAFCREESARDTCPNCGRVITGGMWGGQSELGIEVDDG